MLWIPRVLCLSKHVRIIENVALVFYASFCGQNQPIQLKQWFYSTTIEQTSQFMCFFHASWFFEYSPCESGFLFFHFLLARMNSYIVYITVYTVIFVYFSLTIFQLNARTVQCINSIIVSFVYIECQKVIQTVKFIFILAYIYNVQYLFESSTSASFHRCFWFFCFSLPLSSYLLYLSPFSSPIVYCVIQFSVPNLALPHPALSFSLSWNVYWALTCIMQFDRYVEFFSCHLSTHSCMP